MNEKLSIIVNDLNSVKNFGRTYNLEHINFNLKMLGENFKDKIDLHHLFSNNGMTSVFQLGRFITVLKQNKLKTEGEMIFFDFTNIGDTSSGLKDLLKRQFSETIINEWFRIYYLMGEEFDEEQDFVELILV